jgi:hypothetical protein
VIFPKRVEYLDGEFRTPEMSLIFSIFHAVEVPKEGEASPTGFEPGGFALKCWNFKGSMCPDVPQSGAC